MKPYQRALSLLLLCSLLFLLVSCGSLCDRAEKKLTKEGYTVLRYGEGSQNPLAATDEDVITLLKANKGGVWLYVYEFCDEETALAFYGVWKDKYSRSPNMVAAIDGRTVYRGMREAYEVLK